MSNNLRSAPVRDGQPIRPDPLARARGLGMHWRAVGLLSLVAGFGLWIVGARYTALGAPQVLVMFAGLFQFTLELARPSGAALLTLTLTLGLTISLAEFGCYPRRSFFTKSLMLGCILLLIWLLANGVDLASTYTGIVTPEPSAGALARWVAGTHWVAITWTAFLTYCPELFIIAGIRWLGTGRL